MLTVFLVEQNAFHALKAGASRLLTWSTVMFTLSAAGGVGKRWELLDRPEVGEKRPPLFRRILKRQTL
jgi:hypothetical protein